MGFSWDQLWNDGKEQVENAFEDVVKTGVPAIKSGLEQWAIDMLQKQNEVTQKELQRGVDEVMNEPSSPIGSAISHSVTGAVQQNMGLYIIAGVVGLVAIGLILRK